MMDSAKSPEEGETIISFTARNRTATITTSQATIFRRLQRKGHVVTRVEGGTSFFAIPKDLISVRSIAGIRDKEEGTLEDRARAVALKKERSRARRQMILEEKLAKIKARAKDYVA